MRSLRIRAVAADIAAVVVAIMIAAAMALRQAQGPVIAAKEKIIANAKNIITMNMARMVSLPNHLANAVIKSITIMTNMLPKLIA